MELGSVKYEAVILIIDGGSGGNVELSAIEGGQWPILIRSKLRSGLPATPNH